MKAAFLFAVILAIAAGYALTGAAAVDQVNGAVSARTAAIDAALGK